MFAFRMIVIYYFRSGDTLVDFEESGAPLHKAWSDGLNRDARLSVDNGHMELAVLRWGSAPQAAFRPLRPGLPGAARGSRADAFIRP